MKRTINTPSVAKIVNVCAFNYIQINTIQVCLILSELEFRSIQSCSDLIQSFVVRK